MHVENNNFISIYDSDTLMNVNYKNYHASIEGKINVKELCNNVDYNNPEIKSVFEVNITGMPIN